MDPLGLLWVTLIHRQETLSFLGIPLSRHIDIDDSEGVLRAIRDTSPGHAIEIVPQPRGRTSQVEYAPGRERRGRRRFP
jgi:hypothetical protein